MLIIERYCFRLLLCIGVLIITTNTMTIVKKNVCGTKLVELVSKVCGNCIRAPTNTIVTVLDKRSLTRQIIEG